MKFSVLSLVVTLTSALVAANPHAEGSLPSGSGDVTGSPELVNPPGTVGTPDGDRPPPPPPVTPRGDNTPLVRRQAPKACSDACKATCGGSNKFVVGCDGNKVIACRCGATGPPRLPRLRARAPSKQDDVSPVRRQDLSKLSCNQQCGFVCSGNSKFTAECDGNNTLTKCVCQGN
ncbi:hypothetical protein LX32DRAFT_728158 [Colletotrichum zoysiae]|uniref:Uncharacterized protein n=1 Tax=Colletotrichum zoysiae TaxID=1216348 RepID=A0AAD9HJ22_9PEZI|nr:hypothetical protein LX32DRAFT_728158 [Colletotrichum zoysiae]